MEMHTSTRPVTPLVAVDGVVLCRHEAPRWRSHWHILLIQRRNPPFQGQWAFPGGFVDVGEDIGAAVHREVEEETGLTGVSFQLFSAYGDPRRDPRGHTVSVIYVGEMAGCPAEVRGGDDAADARWFPLDALPELAFDHAEILEEIMETRRLSL
jgi:8-oxo-dGTP diphosphatase